MRRTTPLAAALLLACSDPPAASIDPPPPAARPITAPTPLAPPELPPANDCPSHHPEHTLTATPAGLTLDGTRHPDAAALAAAIPRESTVALAIDAHLTLADVRPLLAALTDIAPPPRLHISLADTDTDAPTHIPIAGLAISPHPPEPDATRHPGAAYLLALDGTFTRTHDLVDPPRSVPDDTPLTAIPVLVAATEYTPWRTIAAALARPCGSARLIELRHAPPIVVAGSPTRIPTITRTGLLSTRPPGTGWIAPDILRRTARANINATIACHNKAPKLAGRVEIRLRVNESGEVDATVATSTVPDPAIGECLAAAVRRWKLPKPEGGPFERLYPFTLEPQ